MIGAFLNFAAGVAAFTNSITYYTNGNSGKITNEDQISNFGNLYYTNATSAKQAFDFNQKPVSSLAKNTSYFVRNSDGIGYQFNANYPPDNHSTGFAGFTPGSLAYHTFTNQVARTNGSFFTTKAIYSTSFTGTGNQFFNPNWVRNTSFWLKNVHGITAMNAWSTQSDTDSRVTAISPRHVICAAHIAFGLNSSTNFWFTDSSICVSNHVIGFTNIANTDIVVEILANDLPPTIAYLPVLPTTWTNNLGSLGGGVGFSTSLLPILIGNQDELYWTGDLQVTLGTFLGDSLEKDIGFSGFSELISGNTPIRSGDSGNSITMLIGTNLVLMSHIVLDGAGPSYSYYQSSINSAMHWLNETYNPGGTDYQLTIYDLTGFPTY